MQILQILQFYTNFYGKPAAKDYVVGSSNFIDIITFIGGKYPAYSLIS